MGKAFKSERHVPAVALNIIYRVAVPPHFSRTCVPMSRFGARAATSDFYRTHPLEEIRKISSSFRLRNRKLLVRVKFSFYTYKLTQLDPTHGRIWRKIRFPARAQPIKANQTTWAKELETAGRETNVKYPYIKIKPPLPGGFIPLTPRTPFYLLIPVQVNSRAPTFPPAAVFLTYSLMFVVATVLTGV